MYAITLSLAQQSTSNWLYPSDLKAGISQDSIDYIMHVENDLLTGGGKTVVNKEWIWSSRIEN